MFSHSKHLDMVGCEISVGCVHYTKQVLLEKQLWLSWGAGRLCQVSGSLSTSLDSLETLWDRLGTSWGMLETSCENPLGQVWNSIGQIGTFMGHNSKFRKGIYKSKQFVSMGCYSPMELNLWISGVNPLLGEELYNNSWSKARPRSRGTYAQPEPSIGKTKTGGSLCTTIAY